MVVVNGFGQEVILLLTNFGISLRGEVDTWRIVEIYLTRWRRGESFRFW